MEDWTSARPPPRPAVRPAMRPSSSPPVQRRPSPPGPGRSGRHPRQGGVLVYATVALVALIGVSSLAVDWGRVQMVKTDLRRTADVTARGHMALYDSYDAATASYYGPLLADPTANSYADNVRPTVTTTWGYWDASTRQFYAGSNSSYPLALKCIAARSAANGNAVPLMWAKVLGRTQQDVTATSVAVLYGTASASVNVTGTSDLYLSGMPAGSTASYDDTTANAAPYQVTAIPVVPGTYITITGVSGLVRNGPTQTDSSADGKTTIWSHGDSAPSYVTPNENGIADCMAPGCALLGLFLDGSAPNTTTAPTARDYTSAGSRSQATYTDLQLKQPFFIGDGMTGTGTGSTQQFLVPAGATRLYIGVMDGFEYNNNQGSFAATINQVRSVAVVQ